MEEPEEAGSVHRTVAAKAPRNAPGLDTTGDGMIDAWDTTGDGVVDAWDTTGDGRIDTRAFASGELPSLFDAAVHERPALFAEKLGLCTRTYTPWSAANAEERARKGGMLKDLRDYVMAKRVLTEATYPLAVRMVRANLFRTLPPCRRDLDDEGDGDDDEDDLGGGGGSQDAAEVR
jgi:hypothetical protein